MACGVVHRFRKPTTAAVKVILPFLIIIVIVFNVTSTSLFFSQSVSQQITSSESQPGEIGPKYIRSVSDISNSELLHFILTNGTGDISAGGQMPVKIVEPFIQRLQMAEEMDRRHEKSLKILTNSMLEEEQRRVKTREENLNKDDDKSNNNNNNDNNKVSDKEYIKQTGPVAKNIFDCVLKKDVDINTKNKKEVDDDFSSLLVKRMLENAIVRPPPPPITSSASSSPSSSSSLSSSSSSSSSQTVVEGESTVEPKKKVTQSSRVSPTKITRKVDAISQKQHPARDKQAETNEQTAQENSIRTDKSMNTKSVKSSVNSYTQESSKGKQSTVTELKSNVSKSKDGNITDQRPHCTDINHKTLVGRMRVQTNVHTLSQLQTSNMITDVEVGGHFRPRGCIQREKTAIIIPFRDREEHLAILLLNLFPVLKRQGLDITVFVIDENIPTPFNRAMLFNIGFIEANKLSKFDCFIFHDVDLIPIDDRNIYQCNPEAPIHFSVGVDKFNYKLPYRNLFGGVVAFSKTQYEEINGASNLYFGWGGEDDDLRKRCINKFQKVLRKNKTVGLYNMIKHDHSSASNKINPVRSHLLSKAIDRQDIEGLNTTTYHVTSINRFPLYTKIDVDIDFERVLRTAPRYLWKQMEVLKHNFTPAGP